MQRLSRTQRRLVAEHDAALAQAVAFFNGEGDYKKTAERLLAFLREHAPATADPLVAGALFDIARASLQFESAASSWVRASAAASTLASAVTALQLAAERAGQRHLDPRFQSRLRGFADEALYVLHRAGSPSGVACAAEAMIGASYLDRQMLETVDLEQLGPLQLWIDRLAEGARRIHMLPTEPVASVTEGERISWSQLTTDAAVAITLPADELVNHALASQATTLVAAHLAARDVIYVVAGSQSGATVRFHHDPFTHRRRLSRP